ncbi:MAG: immune inhibitor A [Anaerolineaceae bacterium]|nr:immune inhibitor A [Anaerolineaceae bacterium]
MSQNPSRTWIIVLIVISSLAVMCCCCAAAGFLVYRYMPTFVQTPVFGDKTEEANTPLPSWLSTPETSLQTAVPNKTVAPLPTALPVDPAELEKAQETLKLLQEVVIPSNDPIDLANRLGGKVNVPKELIDPEAPYSVGAKKKFWVSNVDSNKNFQIDATLRYVGDNIYFWIEDSVNYKEKDLKAVAELFDKKYIPTDRAFFGSEWNPGVDGDPRLYVLYAGGLGNSLAGYFSSVDELHPDAHPYSNAHEMFLINSDNVGLNEDYLHGTMAHEFQHMIHWYQDKNEETWMNEGFSMLAEHVNGLDAGGFDYEFAAEPDLQLTDWGEDVGTNGPHYGSAYLFMVYFLDRFGEDASKALVAEKENGLASVSKVMQDLKIINPTTGKPYTGEEVFQDWTLANLIQNPAVEEGRYAYKSYSPPSFTIQNSMENFSQPFVGTVHQFGTQYIELNCSGQHSIEFSGSHQVKLLPVSEIPSGEYFMWSNAADESNPRLTRTFDLSQASGPISLDFKVWYELEKDYDFAFVSASTDGQTWKILKSRSCTTENVSGNSYGCGWNGNSSRWIDESVDLSAYAGTKVTIRFDYVTDAAVNLNGLAIDDMHLDAIKYKADFEKDDGGWQTEGFARVTNYLPQEFAVSLIQLGRNPSVEQFTVSTTAQLSIPLHVESGTKQVILAISGITPVTREKADFSVNIR